MTAKRAAYLAEWCKTNRDKRRAYRAKSRAKNPEAARQRCRLWRKANAERVRTYNAAQYAMDPAKHRARTAKHRATNPESARASQLLYAARYPERRRAIFANYRKAHRMECRAHREARRARKRSAPGRGVTASQLLEVLSGSAGLCVYCVRRKILEADHIEPLIRGGEHDVENLTPACRQCNSSKLDTPLLVWLAKRASRLAIQSQRKVA